MSFTFYRWPQTKFKKGCVPKCRRVTVKPTRDLGTPELQQHKQRLLKMQKTQGLTLSALDCLYARELISHKQQQAGWLYHDLAFRVRKVIQAPSLQIYSKTPVARASKRFDRPITASEKLCARLEDRWSNVQHKLQESGRAVVQLTHRTVVEDKVDLFLLIKSPQLLKRLQTGLEILELFFL